jgi:hypothetical protein
MATTAKIKVSSKTVNGDGQVTIQFFADYENSANTEWAKYTPALSLSMTVIDSVAEQFTEGQAITLTLDPTS